MVSQTSDTISGSVDSGTPWSLPVVFKVDKSNPAARLDICETVARAVVKTLVEKTSDPAWSGELNTWMAGRFRKVVRRAKPAMFEASDVLDNVTFFGAKAEVKVFTPTPVDALPSLLSKMQVSGSEPSEGGEPSSVYCYTILVNPELSMSVGKTAAQVAHAAQLLLMDLTDQEREIWVSKDYTLRVMIPSKELWEEKMVSARVQVVDAGLTEIPPGSKTTLAY